MFEVISNHARGEDLPQHRQILEDHKYVLEIPMVGVVDEVPYDPFQDSSGRAGKIWLDALVVRNKQLGYRSGMVGLRDIDGHVPGKTQRISAVEQGTGARGSMRRISR